MIRSWRTWTRVRSSTGPRSSIGYRRRRRGSTASGAVARPASRRCSSSGSPKLLDRGVPPTAITYLTGELIDDHHGLLLHLNAHLDDAPAGVPNYLVVDEVTYIRDWDKAVKFAADAGLLERTALVLTGSDLGMVQDARMRFPGRRGQADVTDFHLHPCRSASTWTSSARRRTGTIRKCLPPSSTRSTRRSTATSCMAATSRRSTILPATARFGRARSRPTPTGYAATCSSAASRSPTCAKCWTPSSPATRAR